MANKPLMTLERQKLHLELLDSILTLDDKDIPSNADKDSNPSVALAREWIKRIGTPQHRVRSAGQTAGSVFEQCVCDFVRSTFCRLGTLRPGKWIVEKSRGTSVDVIAKYEQYSHLASLASLAKDSPVLAPVLGNDYVVTPDIVVERMPEPDEAINSHEDIVGEDVSLRTPIRLRNNHAPILHASISCKWTIRSDRVQNARSEGHNLIKNRKGRLPHVVVVTAEPSPNRIAAIALGTGEIDCVYHLGLDELRAAAKAINDESSAELLGIMIDGNRLRDIGDLPLDLTV